MKPRQFLKDTARSKLIDRLLKDPRYATRMGNIWLPILISRKPAHPEVQRRHPVNKWLTDKFARNEPYDRSVRKLFRERENRHQQTHRYLRPLRGVGVEIGTGLHVLDVRGRRKSFVAAGPRRAAARGQVSGRQGGQRASSSSQKGLPDEHKTRSAIIDGESGYEPSGSI